MVEAWNARAFAISRFRLLGAIDVVKAIEATQKPQGQYRDATMFNNNIPDSKFWTKWKGEIYKHRKEVQEATSL